MSRQEQELDAAEYVIGTLSGVERRVFEDLMATNKQTQEDVWYWERAFGALNASISPDAPPAEMWERIEGSLPSNKTSRRLPSLLKTKKLKEKKKIEPAKQDVRDTDDEPIVSVVPELDEDGEKVEEVEPKKSKSWFKKTPEPVAEPEEIIVPAPALEVVEADDEKIQPVEKKNRPDKPVAKPAILVEKQGNDRTRKPRRWWLISLLAILCFFAFIWWLFNQKNTVDVAEKEPVSPVQQAKQYLAVVNANGNQPSLVVQIDTANDTMKVNPIGILIPSGKSLQLWYRPKNGERVEIGLLSDEPENFSISEVEQGGVLEITVEPEGGAPTDEPSGPVVYSGALAEMQP